MQAAARRRALARYLAALTLTAAIGLPAMGQDAGHAPRLVVYYNSEASPASMLIGLPYTHVILSFITARVSGAGTVEVVVADNLAPALPEVAPLKADGKIVLVSFGGGDMRNADYRPLVGKETELAAAIAAFVTANGFDGVDIDFEVSEALHATPPRGSFDGRQFLIDLTTALRAALPPDAVLTHAPQGPFFNPDWHGAPYVDIMNAVGDQIDWITVQYYNNPGYDDPLADGDTPDPWTYQGLVDGSDFDWRIEDIVVGKPIYTDDAATGYLAPQALVDQIITPLVALYGARFGGLAGWQFSTLTDDHQFWNNEMAPALTAAPDPAQVPAALP